MVASPFSRRCLARSRRATHRSGLYLPITLLSTTVMRIHVYRRAYIDICKLRYAVAFPLCCFITSVARETVLLLLTVALLLLYSVTDIRLLARILFVRAENNQKKLTKRNTPAYDYYCVLSFWFFFLFSLLGVLITYDQPKRIQ